MPTTKLPSVARLQLALVVHRETIGERIAARRKQLKLSQEELAERVGVRAQTVSRWERGKNLGRLNNLEQLATALETTVGELMDDLEQPGAAKEQLRSRVRLLEEELKRVQAQLEGLGPIDVEQGRLEAEAATLGLSEAEPEIDALDDELSDDGGGELGRSAEQSG